MSSKIVTKLVGKYKDQPRYCHACHWHIYGTPYFSQKGARGKTKTYHINCARSLGLLYCPDCNQPLKRRSDPSDPIGYFVCSNPICDIVSIRIARRES